LKHFPGHGSSKDDTHFGIADVTNTWEERELKPYIELINSGDVDAIMSAHIVNKKLDPDGNPGTLSTPILTGILRNKLNYSGVVFSDDMQMMAITKHYGLEEAIRRAIIAGIDIMTFSNNISGSEERTVDKVHQIIKNFVQTGVITEDRINQSYKRVVELKKRITTDPLEYYTQKLREEEEEIIALKKELQTVQEEKAKLQKVPTSVVEEKKKKKKK
jgi:beta-N-acetylhexosaminidase